MENSEFNEHYGEVIHDLVTRCPVARSTAGDGYWVVTRYEDVRACAQDWETFSSAAGGVFLTAMEGVRKQVLEEMDPPLHDHWRKILGHFLGPVAVARYADSIRAVCGELIDGFIEDGRCDIVPAFSAPFPGLCS